MFWRFGGYSSIAPIHAILDKPGHSLEDLLDEQELASELKQHDARLIEYLRDDRVIRRLIAIVRAPRPKYQADDEDWLDDDEPKKITSIERADDADKEEQTPKPKPKPTKKERTEHMRIRTDGEAQRRRRAEVASDTLSADVWSLIESIMQDDKHLLELWSYLDSQPPLEPQTASNFVKVNESLADKKTEAMVKFLQGYGASVEKLLKHVECPVIMDLCMKLLSLSNAEGGEGILDVSNGLLCDDKDLC